MAAYLSLHGQFRHRVFFRGDRADAQPHGMVFRSTKYDIAQRQSRKKWVRTANDEAVAKLEIVEFLHRAHNIKTAVNDFRIDESQCTVSFKGPGYSADGFINRETGEYELTENRMGFVAVINDLHKGRDTGVAWSWLIDISAVFMTFVSLTGMALIFFLKRRRVSGLIMTVIGGVACWLVYWFGVS